MKKLEVVLAGVLAFSPALFAQQSTSQSNDTNTTASQSTQMSSQTGQKAASKSKLTTEQKTELKQLRTKAKEACKADKTSEACKSAKQDLRAKADEYGVKRHHHHKATTTGSSTQSPS